MLEHQPVRKELSLDFSSSKKFVIDKQNYAPQYAQLYFCRLCALRDPAMAAAHARWGKPTESFKYANRIVDIRADEDEKQTAVVGIIFREMIAKPSILHQYNTVTNMLIPPPPNRSTTPYSSASDKLIIEDENGRCNLDITQIPNRTRVFTTGIVLAVRGFESLESGCFVVTDVTSIGSSPQRPLTALPADAFIAFVSGIELGGDLNGLLSIELLLEFLKGNVGDDKDATDCAAIVQLIVAGNLITAPKRGEGVAACIRNTQRAVTDDQKMTVAEPIVEVDRFLTAAASVMPVAVMPGENDPVNYLMPQQAIHRCLLPSASRGSNVHRATNPLSCEVEGRFVLGTSGQPVSDFMLYGELPNADAKEEGKQTDKSDCCGDGILDVLETMLDSRHISPTCPDTLGSYPFSKDDPFVLTESPHIFFAGNQTEFASRVYKNKTQSAGGKQEMKTEPVMVDDVQCRLVAVPKFRESGQIVLVNLRTLVCTVREFAMSV